jgi:chemotaxis protein histidine kinase CheA
LINAGKNVIAWFNEVRESGGFVGAIFNGIASAAGAVVDKLVGVAEFIGLVDSAEEKQKKNKEKAEKAKQKAIEETAKFEEAKNKEKVAADAAADAAAEAADAAATAAAKERAKKLKEINAQFNKEMMSLADELTLMMIADEDERGRKQLEIQKKNDLASIDASEFTAEQKGKLKAQIDAKYDQLEITRQQAQNEKLKKGQEDYQRFLEEQGLKSEEGAKEAEDRKYSAYLELWKLKQENELLGIENEEKRKLKELEMHEQNEIAKVEASEFAAEIIDEIQKKYAALRVKNEIETQKATNIAMADGFSQLSSGFGQMVSSFAQISGEGAEYTKALAVIGVQIQLATALAAAIAGATTAAAATGPGAPFALAGYIASMVGAVVAAFAQTTQLLTAEVPKPAFYEGTAYLQRGGNPKGKDTIPVMAHEGEAIIPTGKNLQYPGLAKSWIDGSLDGYINKNFVRPALMEQQRQAEEDFADRLANSMALQMSSNFDDYRLFRAIKEQTAVNRTGFETMKINRKKIRGGR